MGSARDQQTAGDQRTDRNADRTCHLTGPFVSQMVNLDNLHLMLTAVAARGKPPHRGHL